MNNKKTIIFLGLMMLILMSTGVFAIQSDCNDDPYYYGYPSESNAYVTQDGDFIEVTLYAEVYCADEIIVAWEGYQWGVQKDILSNTRADPVLDSYPATYMPNTVVFRDTVRHLGIEDGDEIIIQANIIDSYLNPTSGSGDYNDWTWIFDDGSRTIETQYTYASHTRNSSPLYAVVGNNPYVENISVISEEGNIKVLATTEYDGSPMTFDLDVFVNGVLDNTNSLSSVDITTTTLDNSYSSTVPGFDLDYADWTLLDLTHSELGVGQDDTVRAELVLTSGGLSSLYNSDSNLLTVPEYINPNTEPIINSIIPSDRVELKSPAVLTQLYTSDVTDNEGDAIYSWTLGGIEVSTTDSYQANWGDITPGIYTLELEVSDAEYSNIASTTLEIRAKGGKATSSLSVLGENEIEYNDTTSTRTLIEPEQQSWWTRFLNWVKGLFGGNK